MNFDIPMERMIWVYASLILPVGIFYALKMHTLSKDLIIAVAKMTVQLVFIAFYLVVLFDLNNLWLNLAWLVVMVLIANWTILGRTKMPKKAFFLPVLIGLFSGTALIAGLFIGLLIQPDPWFDARYLIPLVGMILGNSMQGNVIVLERFYHAMEQRREEYLSYVFMGATQFEAARPFLREALSAALAPTVAMIGTTGIVFLPGMMTGQILAGADPTEAVKYQIMILIGIAIAVLISTLLSTLLSLKYAAKHHPQ